MYKWGFIGGAIAGGMYDTDQRLKKEGEMNNDVLFDCIETHFHFVLQILFITSPSYTRTKTG